MPPAVFQENDTVCTHEWSGPGSNERHIRKLCPEAKLLPGLAIVGGIVGEADRELASWLKRLGLAGGTGG